MAQERRIGNPKRPEVDHTAESACRSLGHGPPTLVATEAYLALAGRSPFAVNAAAAPNASVISPGLSVQYTLARASESRGVHEQSSITEMLQDEMASGFVGRLVGQVDQYRDHSAVLAETTSENDQPRCFQVTLRPDQLARLWLRESTLNANNVLSWSSERQRWIPALTLPTVNRALARARIERVRGLNLLNAARNYRPLTPPRSIRSLPSTSVRRVVRSVTLSGAVQSDLMQIPALPAGGVQSSGSTAGPFTCSPWSGLCAAVARLRQSLRARLSRTAKRLRRGALARNSVLSVRSILGRNDRRKLRTYGGVLVALVLISGSIVTCAAKLYSSRSAHRARELIAPRLSALPIASTGRNATGSRRLHEDVLVARLNTPVALTHSAVPLRPESDATGRSASGSSRSNATASDSQPVVGESRIGIANATVPEELQFDPAAARRAVDTAIRRTRRRTRWRREAWVFGCFLPRTLKGASSTT